MTQAVSTDPFPFVPFALEETEQSIQLRFELAVQRHADRVAIETDSGAIRYSELDQRSNRIAHAILEMRGTSPEPVGLLLDQGVAAVAAILAVLKAGKFYVPLDPGDPSARISDIVKDSGAALIVTDLRRAEFARETADTRASVLDLTDLRPGLSSSRPDVDGGPDETAYLFYTSGTTGRPKGVFDTHRNVLHNVMRYTNGLRISRDDKLTLIQSCSFSGTVSSLFGALLNGACLLPLDFSAETPGRFAEWLQRRRATIYHSVPTIFRSLCTAGERSFDSVRIIRLEGDTASQRDLDLHRECFSESCVLVNGLGATETGLVAQNFIRQDDPRESGVVSVGHPVAGVQIQVLGEQGQLVEANEVGEIAVLGRHLASGYWKRPELTRERFRAAPDAGPEMRLFLTGDLGRIRTDGCLEHLGRSDARAKIRGQTVELSAIEAAVQDLDEVEAAAVGVREDGAGERYLVAYVVSDEHPPPPPGRLRRGLAPRLAAVMIPTRFVFIDALPLTSSAKVDRQALSRIPTRSAGEGSSGRAHNLGELQLAEIWKELLDLETIGVTDDFFDLGGHSLLAVQMLDRVQQELGVQLPVECLVQGASIDHVSQWLERCEESPPVVELQTQGSAPPFYFLHGDYNWGGLYCRRLSEQLGPDQPLFLLSPCRRVAGEEIPRSFSAMARVHIEHLRAHRPRGPYRLGGTCNGGQVAFEMARELANQGEEIERLVLVGSSAANLRYRHLRETADLLRLVGVQPHARTTLYLLLKQLAQLPERRSAREVVAHVAGEAGRIPNALRRVRQGAAMLDPSHGPTAIYQQIGREYIPGPYAGRIAVIAAAVDPEPPEEMAKWWRQVGAEVDLYVVPGTHLEGLVQHVGELASRIRAALA